MTYYKKIVITITWLVMVFAVYLLSTTSDGLPPMLYNMDKLLHMLAYMLLSFFPAYKIRNSGVVIIIGVALVLFGIGMEFLQAKIPGRMMSVGDVVANFAGVCMGIIAAIRLRKI